MGEKSSEKGGVITFPDGISFDLIGKAAYRKQLDQLSVVVLHQIFPVESIVNNRRVSPVDYG